MQQMNALLVACGIRSPLSANNFVHSDKMRGVCSVNGVLLTLDFSVDVVNDVVRDFFALFSLKFS